MVVVVVDDDAEAVGEFDFVAVGEGEDDVAGGVGILGLDAVEEDLLRVEAEAIDAVLVLGGDGDLLGVVPEGNSRKGRVLREWPFERDEAPGVVVVPSDDEPFVGVDRLLREGSRLLSLRTSSALEVRRPNVVVDFPFFRLLLAIDRRLAAKLGPRRIAVPPLARLAEPPRKVVLVLALGPLQPPRDVGLVDDALVPDAPELLGDADLARLDVVAVLGVLRQDDQRTATLARKI
mmetsp:Transcript_37724/g.121055  ORF Transcript_37724/g.121055 Transcript_37724/m.121055 type:complete len:234 (-) Transcript_37724:148-849(-)